MKSIGDSAVFSGQNWLSINSDGRGFNGTKSIVSSYSHDAAGAVSVGTIDVVTPVGDYRRWRCLTTATGGAASSPRAFSTTKIRRQLHRQGSRRWRWLYRVAIDDHRCGKPGGVNTLDISALTNSTTDLEQLNAMTQMVDKALGKMTTAASDLGAGKSRVDLQQSFVSALKNSIDKGVGALVDADMNAESTKLQALQVQQQLGVQSLSIANQSSQAILKLFG